MTYGWSGSAWRHLPIPGPLSATKRILRFLLRLRLPNRVAVLIGTSKQAPTKMSSGKDVGLCTDFAFLLGLAIGIALNRWRRR